MKRIIASIAILLASVQLCANPAEFSSTLSLARLLYAQGVDNNSIDSEVIYFPTLKESYPQARKTAVEATFENLTNVVAECVMFKEGAYGDHLNDDVQQSASQELARHLLNQEGLSFYRIDGKFIPPGNLDTAPCALGVRKGRLLMLMQGGLSD